MKLPEQLHKKLTFISEGANRKFTERRGKHGQVSDRSLGPDLVEVGHPDRRNSKIFH